MGAASDETDLYGRALELRVPALENIFGKHEQYLISPIPFYLGGDPTIVGFPHHLSGTVFCTSEMTGDWGSDQKTDDGQEREFVIVTRPNSPLNPRSKNGKVAEKGWVGVILSGLAKYSCQAVMRSGDTVGPWEEMSATPYGLLYSLTSTRKRFEFGGRSYGLLLCMLISESEAAYRRENGVDALVKALRVAGAFPYSDPERASVV